MKVHDFRGATLVDISDRIIPILKKKPNVIILHVETNDSVSRTSREILVDLLQLKSVINKDPAKLLGKFFTTTYSSGPW